jgi:hypothetical protein
MTSVYDTSTFFGLASKTGQNVTILGTGFGSNVEIAEKKNIVKVSGTNCPDTTSNSSYLEIVYVSSSELVLSGVDLTGCSKDINVSIYQRQEDFETNVSIISTAADYIASLSSVVNGSIPNDLKLVVENKIVATIVQITDTYKSLQPLGANQVQTVVIYGAGFGSSDPNDYMFSFISSSGTGITHDMTTFVRVNTSLALAINLTFPRCWGSANNVLKLQEPGTT